MEKADQGLLGIVGVLLAVLVLIVAALFSDRGEEAPRPATESVVPIEVQKTSLNELLRIDPARPDIDPLTKLQGHAPLKNEPAGLPNPPGGTNLSRFSRTAEGVREDISIWRIDGVDGETIDSFYVEALQDSVFEQVTKNLYRTDRGNTLSLSIQPEGDAFHVVIALRYPIETP